MIAHPEAARVYGLLTVVLEKEVPARSGPTAPSAVTSVPGLAHVPSTNSVTCFGPVGPRPLSATDTVKPVDIVVTYAVPVTPLFDTALNVNVPCWTGNVPGSGVVLAGEPDADGLVVAVPLSPPQAVIPTMAKIAATVRFKFSSSQ